MRDLVANQDNILRRIRRQWAGSDFGKEMAVALQGNPTSVNRSWNVTVVKLDPPNLPNVAWKRPYYPQFTQQIETSPAVPQIVTFNVIHNNSFRSRYRRTLGTGISVRDETAAIVYGREYSFHTGVGGKTPDGRLTSPDRMVKCQILPDDRLVCNLRGYPDLIRWAAEIFELVLKIMTWLLTYFPSPRAQRWDLGKTTSWFIATI
jgi:hypothetical protein